VSYDDLSKFIANPRALFRATAMGLPHPEDSERADVIAYLRTLADSPFRCRRGEVKVPTLRMDFR